MSPGMGINQPTADSRRARKMNKTAERRRRNDGRQALRSVVCVLLGLADYGIYSLALSESENAVF